MAAAAASWGRGLGENDPDKVLPFYANDAVMWGTLSPTVLAERAELRDYFVTAFKVLPGLKVAFGEQLIRVYGTTAVNTGYYTFSYSQNGEAKTLPARYSFTYVQNGDRWRVTAVQDEKLARMIAQAMMNNLPSSGAHIQDELQRQLNNLQNRDR